MEPQDTGSSPFAWAFAPVANPRFASHEYAGYPSLGFGNLSCRLALHESNKHLKDFKFGAGEGVRIPAASSGHSYKHIQKKRGKKRK